MRNKIFENIAKLFRKSEIEKQIQRTPRTEQIPEQEHARRKGRGSLKETFTSLFKRRKELEVTRPEQPVPVQSLPFESSIVISNFREEISRVPTPERGKYRDIITTTLEEAIDIYGIDIIGGVLQDNATEIAYLLNAVYYDSDQERVQTNLARLISIIENEAMDIEESKRLTEATEQSSPWVEITNAPSWDED